MAKTYTVGKLTVDLISSESNELVWHGEASEEISLNQSEKKSATATRKLIKRLLKDIKKQAKNRAKDIRRKAPADSPQLESDSS